MGLELGNANARIGLDVRGFVLGMRVAENATRKMEQEAKKGFTIIGDAAQRYVGIANSATVSTERLAKAEQQLTNVQQAVVKAYLEGSAAVAKYRSEVQQLDGIERRRLTLKGPQSNIFGMTGRVPAALQGALPSFTPTGFEAILAGIGGGSRGANRFLKGPLLPVPSGGAAGAGLLGNVGKLAGAIGLGISAAQALHTIVRNIGNAIENWIKSSVEFADNLKVSRALFAGYLGSVTASEKMMRNLQGLSAEMGIGFQDTVLMAQTLTPALANAGKEISDINSAIMITRRLASLNLFGAQGGFEGAAISIGEAMASGGSNLISIERRFNIPSEILKPLVAQNQGDVIAALDQYLNKLGITNETAKEVTNTWEMSTARLGDAFNRLGANIIQPLLDGLLIPFVNWLTNSVNKVAELVNIVKTHGSGILGPILRQAGMLLKLGVDLGKVFGIFKDTPVRQGRDDKSGVTATLTLLVAPLQVVLDNVLLLFKALPDVINMTLFGFDFLNKSVAFTAIALLDFTSVMVKAIMFVISVLNMMGANIDLGGFYTLLENIDVLKGSVTDFSKSLENFTIESLAASEEMRAEILRFIEEGFKPEDLEGMLPEFPTEIDQEAIDKFGEYFDSLEELNEDFKKQQEQNEKEYLDRRQKVIDDFNKRQQRDAEDFERDKARERENLDRDIAKLIQNSGDEERKLREEFNSQLSEMTVEFNNEEAQRLADHLLNLQRMDEDHRDALNDAAARLDAVAMIKEIQSYNKERRRADEDFNREQSQRSQQFTEKYQQEALALEEEIKLRQDANDQKINDMIIEFEREQQIAQENFNIKRQRELEDFQQELNELAIQYANEKALLIQNHQDKIIELNKHYADVLTAENAHYFNLQQIQKKNQAQIEENWKLWLETMGDAATAALKESAKTGGGGGGGSGITGPPPAQMQHTGGLFTMPGFTRVDAGEGIVNAAATRQIVNELGGFSQRSIVDRVLNGNSNNITVSVPISITGVSDPAAVGEEVKDVIDKHLIMRLRGYLNE